MKLKYDGKIHELKGLCINVYGLNGKMYVREICSCGGCFDRTWEIQENDVVKSFKHLNLSGHLKRIKLVSMKFTAHENTILDDVSFESHQSAIDFYCGSQLYDNYGIDGGKSFASGLIKALEKDGIKVDTDIKLPNAAQ